MKNNLILCSLLFLGACTGNTDKQVNGVTETTGDTKYITRTDTVYLERNTSISPANSYSDLFLDSANLSDFSTRQHVSGDLNQGIRSFYNYRNFQFAWFTSQGFTEQAKGFWNLQDKLGFKAPASLRNRMDTLLNNDSLVISRYDTAILQTELALTQAYLEFYNANRSKTHFAGIPAEKAIPVMKMNTLALADSILKQPADSSAGGGTDQYTLLRKQLATLRPLANSDTSMARVDTSVKMKTAKKATKPSKDTAMTNMQRIQQLIVNIYRAQWMPMTRDSNYISVNIPDFKLSVYQGNAKQFDIPVAVGKEGTGTTIFTGELNQVVFSPYWNIPVSIVKNEILPKMKADPKYLASRNMERVGGSDENPVIRQKPGKDNALGRVKFLFPNRYDIYFHDTYNKAIFNQAIRAVSHGCIRLQDPEKLANYLLRNDKTWTPDKVKAAMNGSKEQFVKVSPPVSVWITYYTVWVDDAGQVQTRPDIYGHDRETARMLFTM